MSPRQACIVLVGFVMLMAGVTVNALHLQGDAALSRRLAGEKSPAAAAPDRGSRTRSPQTGRPGARSADPPRRAALLKPDSAKDDAVAEAPPEAADTDTIRAIQRELKQRGFGPLASDGIVRPATRAAIMAFEHDSRMPLTGEATEALLKRLLLGAPAVADVSGVGEVRSAHAEAIIRQVQRVLTARGYRPGALDGRLSAETVAAIRSFETDQGLAPRGRISAEVLIRLEGPPETKAASAR